MINDRCKKLIKRVKLIEADQYGIVLDILMNDDVSSDKEILNLLLDETNFNKAKLASLIKSERSNFLKSVFKNDKDALKAIKKYI